MWYSKSVAEIIPFPVPKFEQKKTEDAPVEQRSSNVLYFRSREQMDVDRTGVVTACFSRQSPKVLIGGEVIIKILGISYKGVITNILDRDENGNTTKIEYVVPHLNADDPHKFGSAYFVYKIEPHE